MKKPSCRNISVLVILVNLLLFIPMSFLFASDLHVGKLYLHFRGGKKLIEVVEFEGIVLSKNCFKQGPEEPRCNAYDATKMPEHLKETKDNPIRGNPAAHYCEQKGGASLILRDRKESQYSFCYFKADASFIDSWQLLESAAMDLSGKTLGPS